jgi:hypothetical protein
MALIRVCDVCGAFDDHPRHVFAAAPGEFPVNEAHLAAALALTDDDFTAEERAHLVTTIVDTTEQDRHMDCCLAAGCPDGSCSVPGSSGFTGNDLRAFITGE